MEITTLFTEQKWNILKSLSTNKFSPLQLAQSSDTSIANISQQLRLLEAAELVKKEKIKNRDKGKPRTLFSLSNDYAYMVSAMKDFADKKLLILTEFHKTLLRILFIEDTSSHYFLIKYFMKIEDQLNHIDGIILISTDDDIELMIISENGKELEKKLTTQIKSTEKIIKNIKIQIRSHSEASRLAKEKKGPFSRKLNIIHDPTGTITTLDRGDTEEL